MEDQYETKLTCPYCLDETTAYYAESCKITEGTCENCGYDFGVVLEFKAIRLGEKSRTNKNKTVKKNETS